MAVSGRMLKDLKNLKGEVHAVINVALIDIDYPYNFYATIVGPEGRYVLILIYSLFLYS